MLRFFYLFLIGVGLILPSYSFAVKEPSLVRTELISETETIQPGKSFRIAVRLELKDGWHVYWKNPGDAGIPLKIEWKVPEGFKVGPLQWPFPEKFTVADQIGFGYENEVILLSLITPPSDLKESSLINLQANVQGLVCSATTCQPENNATSLDLRVAQHPSLPRPSILAFFEQAQAKIPLAHIEVKTVRKDNLVQLEFDAESAPSQEGEIRDVYFFPEKQDVIDHSIHPTVSSSKDSNRYLVNLQGADEIGAHHQSLKGVLVLHKQLGGREHFEAIDVDSLIEDEKGVDLLSFADIGGSHLQWPTVGDQSMPKSSSFQFEGGIALALVFAFVGGLILNLMPCVLPVISFKVMSFIKMAGQSRSLIFKHGLIFSIGVIFSFWVLASLMLVLRAYGQAVGWGFQLQEPLFVVALAILLFVFSLNLFGVFEWGMGMASWAGEAQGESKQKGGYTGSFLSGMLATAVATPCTGPFLGSAVGFAVTLPWFSSLLIFTFLGLGMSFPYLLLAAFPACLRFLPRPGAWMDTFKQLMGFFLLATVLWLLWVFSAQTGAFALMCLLVGFLCFAIGAWIYGKGCHPLMSAPKRIVTYLLVAGFAILGLQAILFSRGSWSEQENSLLAEAWQGWEDFSPMRVSDLRRQGKPVFIDFTAKWCLICQANHMVLASSEVEKAFFEAGVVKMKADWTKTDSVITEELSKFGRSSVPLYILYGQDEKEAPVILPQVLTVDVVLEYLRTALAPKE